MLIYLMNFVNQVESCHVYIILLTIRFHKKCLFVLLHCLLQNDTLLILQYHINQHFPFRFFSEHNLKYCKIFKLSVKYCLHNHQYNFLVCVRLIVYLFQLWFWVLSMKCNLVFRTQDTIVSVILCQYVHLPPYMHPPAHSIVAWHVCGRLLSINGL